jgi:hypothetical protein
MTQRQHLLDDFFYQCFDVSKTGVEAINLLYFTELKH